MSSEDEDMEYSPDPDTSEQGNKDVSTIVLPTISKAKYDRVYEEFQKWNKLKGATPVSENVLMKYFSELAEKKRPTTLLAYYSMIKATLRLNDNMDIASWSKLVDFLKGKMSGYQPNKSKLFTDEEIEKFINKAPDDKWLYAKVSTIEQSHFVCCFVRYLKMKKKL